MKPTIMKRHFQKSIRKAASSDDRVILKLNFQRIPIEGRKFFKLVIIIGLVGLTLLFVLFNINLIWPRLLRLGTVLPES